MAKRCYRTTWRDIERNCVLILKSWYRKEETQVEIAVETVSLRPPGYRSREFPNNEDMYAIPTQSSASTHLYLDCLH